MAEIPNGLQSTRRVLPITFLRAITMSGLLRLRKSNRLFDSVSGDCAECFRQTAKAAAISMLMATNFERISYISLRGLSLQQECP